MLLRPRGLRLCAGGAAVLTAALLLLLVRPAVALSDDDAVTPVPEPPVFGSNRPVLPTSPCDNVDDYDPENWFCYVFEEENSDDCSIVFSDIPSSKKCACAGPVHEDRDGIINYTYLEYCSFGGAKWLGGILLFGWCLYLFFVLASTADDYLVPALTVFSEVLHLSPNVAGVTVLALANGAPDLFTSIATFTKDSGSGDLGIGAVLGSGMFIISLIVGTICVISTFRSHRRPLLRDLLFLGLAVGMFFIVFRDKKVYMWEAFLFLGLYIGYVLIVIIGRMVHQSHKRMKKRRERKAREMQESRLAGLLDNEAPGAFASDDAMLSAEEKSELEDEDVVANSLQVMVRGDQDEGLDGSGSEVDEIDADDGSDEEGPQEFGRLNYEITHKHRHHHHEDGHPVTVGQVGDSKDDGDLQQTRQDVDGSAYLSMPDGDASINSGDLAFLQAQQAGVSRCQLLMWLLSAELKAIASWEERETRLQKALCVAEYPFTLMRRLSIPLVEEDSWSRGWITATTLCFPHIAFVAFDLSGSSWLSLSPHIWWLIIGPFATLGVWKVTPPRVPAHRRNFYLCYIVVSFLMACIWTLIFASEIVDLMQLFGELVGVSDGVVGVTVLAWGNSVGDLIADVAVAKEGMPRMAAAGTWGGVLFNILIGTGVAFLIKTIQDYPDPLELDPDKQGNIGFLFLAITLVATVVVVIGVEKFHFTRRAGIFLIVLYCLYLLFAILTEAGTIPEL